MDAEVWPDPRVAGLVNEELLPVRVHVRDDAQEYRRLAELYGAQWTPTSLVLDPGGEERHRIEGFLPVEELVPQIELGLGRVAFARGDYEEAERRFRDVVDRAPGSEAAPAALYWAGVARFKATDDGAALAQTAEAFRERYQDTPWAKKSSVWLGSSD
ncbi:MAG TPA: tetratricopeptide repeat protein [Longimicrobiales bacterium]|nr:tetratricopeptide repeat protein [Longimicrobiales bacterium]